jgi:hypothetical protein
MPGIVILDKSGNIRIKHIGYSPAEDLVGKLTKHIEAFLSE